MTPDGAYKLPDNLAYIETDTCNFFAQTNTAETYADYKKTDSFSLSVEAKFKVIGGSYSQKDEKIREEIYNYKMSVSETNVLVKTCNFYIFQAFSYILLIFSAKIMISCISGICSFPHFSSMLSTSYQRNMMRQHTVD